ncbi:MAG: bifunctional diaminohydroxyphosphoribosylaminopyrimidine deaminase/5-amino-6-(5-phosphoribosylamino)uracil reductase RibD [candidate division Zixibacteria bacterium]|nr:bifunctional diaminohydroxyphosphoribosylaminopyrimidine deaminase/5-amino-6-(5-phosphoribosylamino)uracil reductase RibD [candidate division Zixibacteria bacterium]
MQRALEIAEKGRGKVSPNPLVGAVIVKDGEIMGEGYHEVYGGPHAEINAMRGANSSCKGATLYLTLEPCSHHGKTPPCVNSVMEAGFKRVVIAAVDPNPKTNGKSITMMMDAGIEVDVGLLEEKARRQNEIFFKYIATSMPFVILKAAQTLDSKIADTTGHPKWITSDESRAFVHSLRSYVDAVAIGARTAVIDNPRLSVRHVEGRDPYRIILQDRTELPGDLHLFKDNEDNKTIIAAPPNEMDIQNHKQNAIMWSVDAYEDGTLNLTSLLIKAANQSISSILVEGGSLLFTSFLKRKLVDKIYIGIAPKIVGAGTPTFQELGIDTLEHSIYLSEVEYFRKGEDIWVCGYPIWR